MLSVALAMTMIIVMAVIIVMTVIIVMAVTISMPIVVIIMHRSWGRSVRPAHRPLVVTRVVGSWVTGTMRFVVNIWPVATIIVQYHFIATV
jgi:hypothetical protein